MISARGWGSSGHSFRGYKVHSKATWPIQTHTHTLKKKMRLRRRQFQKYLSAKPLTFGSGDNMANKTMRGGLVAIRLDFSDGFVKTLQAANDGANGREGTPADGEEWAE